MSFLKDGGPAFPTPFDISISTGITKRDWFAGMALPKLMTMSGYEDRDCETVARRAYLIADYMLVERERE